MVDRKGNVLVVKGIDVIDGLFILDIKFFYLEIDVLEEILFSSVVRKESEI